MRSVFSALMAYVVSHFRSYASLRLENMALRHQLAVYHHTVTRPKLGQLIDSSGPGSPACGQPGHTPWHSCSPAPSSRGRNTGFAITGDGSVRAVSRAVQPLRMKSATSSKICGTPIPCGGRLALWGSCVSWASPWPNPRWRSTGRASASRPHPRGKPFSITMSKTWWRVISLPFPLPASMSCLCSSCWRTSADASYISTSLNIPRRSGPPSKSSRGFPGRLRRTISSGTGTQSTRGRSSSASRTWASKKSKLPAQSLAESLLRASHRQHAARRARSCHRPQRPASQAATHGLYRLLSPLSHPSFPCNGLSHPRGIQPPETGGVIARLKSAASIIVISGKPHDSRWDIGP